jgi:hypothetical protein
MTGERRVRPFAGLAFRIDIQMAVENQRAPSTSSREANDDVIAAGYVAEGLDRIGVLSQSRSVHRHQDWRKPKCLNMAGYTIHNLMFGLEPARDLDQLLQQPGPVLASLFDHCLGFQQCRIYWRWMAQSVATQNRAFFLKTHRLQPLRRQLHHDFGHLQTGFEHDIRELPRYQEAERQPDTSSR